MNIVTCIIMSSTRVRVGGGGGTEMCGHTRTWEGSALGMCGHKEASLGKGGERTRNVWP